MQFTIFSLIVSIIWVSIFVKVICLLRKQMIFLKYFTIYPLLIFLILCILRLFLSVEWPFTLIINSYKVLPQIQSFLYTPFFKMDSININLAFIIITIWIIGTFSIITKNTRCYYRFSRLLNILPEVTDKHLHDILAKSNDLKSPKKIKIVVHDSIESPAIFGFFRPVILLPNIKFCDDELFSIFIHEITHYKYGHSIIKSISEFIRACFWWNPFFKDMSMEIAHILEMHSDKAVCNRINAAQQKIYLETITKVSNKISSTAIYPNAACSFIEERNDDKLKQRFQMIILGYNNNKMHDVVLIPIIIVMFIISYSVVFQPYSLPSHEDIGLSAEVTSAWYLIKTTEGHNLYDSNNQFIAQIVHIDESLKDLKIYENMEDMK